MRCSLRRQRHVEHACARARPVVPRTSRPIVPRDTSHAASVGTSGARRPAASSSIGGGFAAARRDECDLCSEQIDSSAIELVERTDLRRREQTERVVECARPGTSSAPRAAHAAHGAQDRASVRRRVRGKPPQRRSHHVPAHAPPNARARRPPLRRARTQPARDAMRVDPARSADRSRPPARGEPRAARSAPPRCTPPSARADAGTPPRRPIASKPSDSTACAAVSAIPSCCAARHRSAGSPTGSAAASSSNRRASRGSRANRRVKLCSIPADSGSAAGRPKPPAS